MKNKIMSTMLMSLITLTLNAKTEKATMAKNTIEKEKYGEIDIYIANFNKLFKAANTTGSEVQSVLNVDVVAQLPENEKKWLSNQLVKQRASNVRLSRTENTVKLTHAISRVTLTSFDVSVFKETRSVEWNGRKIKLDKMWSQFGLMEKSKFIKTQFAQKSEGDKSAMRKVFETILFVVTLPLQLVVACDPNAPPEGSDAALAAAAGNTVTPVMSFAGYQSDNSNPRVQTAYPIFECKGYNCSNGNSYDANGSLNH